METGKISMVYTELKNWLTDWSFNIIISRKWGREVFFFLWDSSRISCWLLTVLYFLWRSCRKHKINTDKFCRWQRDWSMSLDRWHTIDKELCGILNKLSISKREAFLCSQCNLIPETHTKECSPNLPKCYWIIMDNQLSVTSQWKWQIQHEYLK